MVKTPQPDVLCAEDQEVFRRKAARLQFMQSVFQGIGGASLFGLVSSLILGGGAVAATLPVWALAAIPLFGVTMIFIGTRCGIESQLLSQTLSAKLMGSAVKPSMGVAPMLEKERDTSKSVPPGMSGFTHDSDESEQATETSSRPAEKPGHKVQTIAALERVEQPGQAVAIH